MNRNSHAITFLIAAAIGFTVSTGCASVPTSTSTPLPAVVQSTPQTNPPTSTPVAQTATSAPTLAIPTSTAGPTKERITFKLEFRLTPNDSALPSL
jgi:hypothetical protein